MRSTSCSGPAANWLAAHPERELITQRYLKHRRAYVQSARSPSWPRPTTSRAQALDDALDEPVVTELPDRPEPFGAATWVGLAVLRRAVRAGCSTWAVAAGRCCTTCWRIPSFTEIVGLDVSAHALELAARKLKLDRRGERARDRITLARVLADVPGPFAGGVRLRRADGGHRAGSSWIGCRLSSGRCSSTPSRSPWSRTNGRTWSTTCASRRCPKGTRGTGTTGSKRRARAEFL